MRGADQRGSATVELAVALPAVMAFACLLLALLAGGARAATCHQAAGAAARAAAIDPGSGAASQVAAQVAPGATVSEEIEGGWTTVAVRCPLALPLGPSHLWARATVPLERP